MLLKCKFSKMQLTSAISTTKQACCCSSELKFCIKFCNVSMRYDSTGRFTVGMPNTNRTTLLLFNAIRNDGLIEPFIDK